MVEFLHRTDAGEIGFSKNGPTFCFNFSLWTSSLKKVYKFYPIESWETDRHWKENKIENFVVNNEFIIMN